METFRLISMIDFVLEHSVVHPSTMSIHNENISKIESHNLILDYATFLKQSLQLGFFVPCDENGNVLDPSDAFRSCEKGFLYGKAKERVLFKGFEYEKTGYGKWSSFMLTCGNYGIQEEFKKPKTIEQFMRSAGFPIELTESAIKQIGR